MAGDPQKGGATSKGRRGRKSAPKRRSAHTNEQKKAAPKKRLKRSAKAAGRSRLAAPANLRAEVARLTQELSEAQQHQAATAEVLNVIASSPHDVNPVFDAIVRTFVRLVQCDRAFILRCDGNSYYPVATAALDGSFTTPVSHAERIDPAANFPSRAIVSKQTVHYPDWSLIALPEYERMIRDRYGMNSSLYLPLLRRGECIGLLALSARRINIFDEGRITLAESFRDQAQIAVENAWLFNEAQAKTRDLAESLQQQTATADVLKAISRSALDLTSVLQTLVESAARLCEADKAVITRQIGEVFYRAEATASRANM